MTLVLTWLSDNYVVQVSHRCVTWSDGRIRPDDRNKAVIFGPATFSYSGLAKIGSEWTDQWLARNLRTTGTMNVFDAGEIVMREATRAFAGLGIPLHLRRHAFVCAGWYCKPPSLRPFIYIISNALNEHGSWQQLPKPNFSATRYELASQNDTALFHIGQCRETHGTSRLARHLRRADHRRAPLAIRDLLAKAIRSVSEIEKSVGKDLFALILPRGAVAPSQSPGSTMAVGIGTAEAYQLPSDDPKRAYRCGALTVLGQHIVDISQMLQASGPQTPPQP